MTYLIVCFAISCLKCHQLFLLFSCSDFPLNYEYQFSNFGILNQTEGI